MAAWLSVYMAILRRLLFLSAYSRVVYDTKLISCSSVAHTVDVASKPMYGACLLRKWTRCCGSNLFKGSTAISADAVLFCVLHIVPFYCFVGRLVDIRLWASSP